MNSRDKDKSNAPLDGSYLFFLAAIPVVTCNGILMLFPLFVRICSYAFDGCFLARQVWSAKRSIWSYMGSGNS